LIEAGGRDNRLIITMPAALPFAYQNRQLGWGYQSGPEPYLDGRTIDEKRGKIIGGGGGYGNQGGYGGNSLGGGNMGGGGGGGGGGSGRRY